MTATKDGKNHKAKVYRELTEACGLEEGEEFEFMSRQQFQKLDKDMIYTVIGCGSLFIVSCDTLEWDGPKEAFRKTSSFEQLVYKTQIRWHYEQLMQAKVKKEEEQRRAAMENDHRGKVRQRESAEEHRSSQPTQAQALTQQENRRRSSRQSKPPAQQPDSSLDQSVVPRNRRSSAKRPAAETSVSKQLKVAKKKLKAAEEPRTHIAGTRVNVYWPSHDQSFAGTIQSFEGAPQGVVQFLVKYDDNNPPLGYVRLSVDGRFEALPSQLQHLAVEL